LGALVDRSQSSEGALEVAQVTNQMLALHARQMIQDQQLRIAQDRATRSSRRGRWLPRKRARAARQSFMTASTRYTPESRQGRRQLNLRGMLEEARP